MNITFTPSEPQAITKENVIVGGKVIGTVEHEPKRERPFFASLDILTNSTNGRAFGFGITREDAIQDAIIKGRAEAELFVKNIAILVEKINE